MCRGYRFPPPTSAPSGHLLPKEGGSIHASPFPWKGLLSAARRGWLPFLRRSRLLFTFPTRGRGTAQRRSGALVYRLLETILLALFHTASTLSAPSGHLLPKEGGCIHASPFPWKGLPSAAFFLGGEAATSTLIPEQKIRHDTFAS